VDVLVWVTPRGPAQVFSIPQNTAARPATAFDPQAGPQRPAGVRLGEKGSQVPWREWAHQLAASRPAPGGGFFGIEQVPDGSTMSQALSVLQQRATLLESKPSRKS
jgi:hypothetical protein